MRNLIRRFVEVGVPGYHIEDQKPGRQEVRPPGRQGAGPRRTSRSSASTRRASSSTSWACRASSWPAPTPRRPTSSTAAATSATSPSSSARPTSTCPSYKAGFLALLRRFHRQAASTELNGHLLYALSRGRVRRRRRLARPNGPRCPGRRGCGVLQEEPRGRRRRGLRQGGLDRFVDVWEAEAGVETYGEAVAEVHRLPGQRGRAARHDRRASGARFARGASALRRAREGARARRQHHLGLRARQDARGLLPGARRHRVRHRQVARGRALRRPRSGWRPRPPTSPTRGSSPRRSTPSFPDKMLAYNLSPSFNWDTTGMTDDEMRALPRGARQDGLRLQLHHLRRPPDRRPRRRGVRHRAAPGRHAGAGPRCSASSACSSRPTARRRPSWAARAPDAGARRLSGRTATTKAMGKGSTQHQHLVQTEVPKKLLEEWLAHVARALRPPRRAHGSRCSPHAPAPSCSSSTLVGKRPGEGGQRRLRAHPGPHGGATSSRCATRTPSTETLRQKRLMTLIHLFLMHRYKVDSVHYVTPTEDNQYQAEKMKAQGLYSEVNDRGRPDHRRRREPRQDRRAARARPRAARTADPQAGLASRLSKCCNRGYPSSWKGHPDE